ncbi:flagellar protein FliT [Azomonas macrocytogenes]|uniref:Flagellar protein FliT n=1 Tax=Azomonas macrocytogenes TaxID=69962 RepID=A0A839SWN1_AZOMA|nr:flagellar protein FliT [Azomonas macrocytogenes]MBB3101797.1 hypothetical protein [Azomonas macrocytogenes]
MNASVEQLAATSGALRNALQRQDWTAIGELDRHCRLVVEGLLREPQRNEVSLRAALQELLDLYRELVGICQHEQQKIAGELIQIKQSHERAKVYRLFG